MGYGKIFKQLGLTVIVTGLVMTGAYGAGNTPGNTPSNVTGNNDGITVTYNAELIDFKGSAPQVINNRTMVPIRAIFETLGLQVGWDEKTQTVSGKNDTTEIKLQIGKLAAKVNDKDVKLDVGALVIKGHTLVPARFIAENMGAQVVWEPRYKNVAITRYQDDGEKIRGEIQSFLNKEKVLVAEWEKQVKKHAEFERLAKQEMARLEGPYKALMAQVPDLKTKYKPIKFDGRDYYGPTKNGKMMGVGLYQVEGGFLLADFIEDGPNKFLVFLATSGEVLYGDCKGITFDGSTVLINRDGTLRFCQYFNGTMGPWVYMNLREGTDSQEGLAKESIAKAHSGANIIYGTFSSVDGKTPFSEIKDGEPIELGCTSKNGYKTYVWMSARYHQLMTCVVTDTGKYEISEEPDPISKLSFKVSTFEKDQHTISFHKEDSTSKDTNGNVVYEASGRGINYIPGEDFVYYGDFNKFGVEVATDISYYLLKGNPYGFRDYVDEIIAKTIKPEMTEREKVTALHDFIVKTYRYSLKGNSSDVNSFPSIDHMAIGFQRSNEGNCEAYSELLNILLNRIGITSQLVRGKGANFVDGVIGPKDQWIGHAWNYVKVDGQFYHVDTTWDDPMPDAAGETSHGYLLVDDAKMRVDHDWE